MPNPISPARKPAPVPVQVDVQSPRSPITHPSKRIRLQGDHGSPSDPTNLLPAVDTAHFYPRHNNNNISDDGHPDNSVVMLTLPTSAEVESRRRGLNPVMMFRRQDEAFAFVAQFHKEREEQEEQRKCDAQSRPQRHRKLHVFSFQWHPRSYAFKESIASAFHNFDSLFGRTSDRSGGSVSPSDHHTDPTSLRTYFQDRYFIAASHTLFYHALYVRLPEEQRHMYEIIREGAPCHLYFDVECVMGCSIGNVQWRKAYDGERFGRLFLQYLNREIVDQFGSSMELQPEQVLTLDSSTEDKFSKHIIVHLFDHELKLPCMLKDNSHAGLFTTKWLRKLGALPRDDEQFSFFFVEKSRTHADGLVFHDEEVDQDSTTARNDLPIIDISVYSKNRAFRLLHSSKAGSFARMEVCRYSTFCYRSGSTEFDHFMYSLVTADTHTYTTEENDTACKEIKLITVEPIPGEEHHHRFPYGGEFEYTVPTNLKNNEGSIYHLINDFILQAVRHRCSSAFLRKVVHSTTSGLIVYHVGNNRYCEKIGRQHKSNHVYLIVDIDRGCYYQKCHDPDCAQFRGVEHKVPDSVLASLRAKRWGALAPPPPPFPLPQPEDDEFFEAIEKAEREHAQRQRQCQETS